MVVVGFCPNKVEYEVRKKYDFSKRYLDIDREFKKVQRGLRKQTTTKAHDPHLSELIDYFTLTKTSGYSAVAMMIYWESGKANRFPAGKKIHRSIVENYVMKNPKNLPVLCRRSISVKIQRSKMWKKLRVTALQKMGRTCMCCGATGDKHNKIHVNHIIPKSIALHLAFNLDNLQILCSRCNHEKGTKVIDYRKAA